MRRASTIDAGSLSSYRLLDQTYDPDKLGLGLGMCQKSGTSPEDCWFGPLPIERFDLYSTVTYLATSDFSIADVITWSNTATSKIDWIFSVNSYTAGTTQTVLLIEVDRILNKITPKGRINLTFPSVGSETPRSIRMTYDTYTVGTASVSGTAVTGTDTLWLDSRLCVGSRIGFGSTDPTAITTWYEISAVGSNTGITLVSGPASPISGGAYVIEDLRAVVATTASVTTLGGLYIAKGLRPELFGALGATTIPAAVATDNIRAVYWLKSATTITETIACGLAVSPKSSWTSQDVYLAHNTSSTQFYKFNLRKNLTLASGADTTAFLFNTPALAVGTLPTNHAARLVTAQHGPGKGQACIYFTYNSARLGRTIPVSSLSATSAWMADNMVGSFLPGGGGTTVATNDMINVVYSATLDMFIATGSNAAPAKSLLFKYNPDLSRVDRMMTTDTTYSTNPTALDTVIPLVPWGFAMARWPVVLSDRVLLFGGSGTSIAYQYTVAPLLSDWEYASLSGARIITPRVATPNCLRYVQALCQNTQTVGPRTSFNLHVQTEPYRMYYRTSGITDNSGAWNLFTTTTQIDTTSAPYIQFMFEFRTWGPIGIPARIHTVGVIWDSIQTDEHFQLARSLCSAASKQFVWRHSIAFGTNVPPLRVLLQDADTGSILVDDNTTMHLHGTFERSTNGSSWSAWTNSDTSNTTTFIRYTPSSIPDSCRIQASLVQV